ncbi:MAG: ATP-sensitive inward rectifier potassium channel 10 [Candidatus Omnitrophica bacterium]|nr:ATP-sensitive inward rectifier potassium channel 10 [Candidatus Omnitrophota bacterium]
MEKRSLHPQFAHFRALINREGRSNIHSSRERHNPLLDLYHYLFSLSWPKFFLCIAAVYLLINLCFGSFYFFDGVDILKKASGLQRFSHCFLLSVENMTAVDYSRVERGSGGVYLLMTVQAFLGLLTLAVITGLFYARFSRATARVIFSNKITIAPYNGRTCLSFRIANERLNQIAEARMSLHMTRNEVSREGEHTRKFYDLNLERSHTPLFSLSWTVRHFIDEYSPLFGMDEQQMKEAQMGILASLTGTDETFSQPIMARHAYSVEDIVYNRRFKDIIIWQDKKVHINLKGIHDLHEADMGR